MTGVRSRSRCGSHGERGTVTLYVLGLCVAVIFLGGLSIDLWRVVVMRGDLATMADGAAAAGADGLDESALRRGEVLLDSDAVLRLAEDHLAAQSDAGIIDHMQVETYGTVVRVTLRSSVPFTLLRVFLAGDPFVVSAVAEAEPRVRI